jgi:hypothetical protein
VNIDIICDNRLCSFVGMFRIWRNLVPPCVIPEVVEGSLCRKSVNLLMDLAVKQEVCSKHSVKLRPNDKGGISCPVCDQVELQNSLKRGRRRR